MTKTIMKIVARFINHPPFSFVEPHSGQAGRA